MTLSVHVGRLLRQSIREAGLIYSWARSSRERFEGREEVLRTEDIAQEEGACGHSFVTHGFVIGREERGEIAQAITTISAPHSLGTP